MSVLRDAHLAVVNPSRDAVDINCDLYVSTTQALGWLLSNGLLVAGSLVGYDDWYETPFMMGGEVWLALQSA